tara:strand:- start:336 stop:884 length:549 start_codon:yes stop_codon:yes gene_type:complete
MIRKKDKGKGWCFIIEGFSGSGKSTISKLISGDIEKLFGRTIILDSYQIRSFFQKVGYSIGYSKAERSKACHHIGELIKLFLNQNINVIHPSVCLNNNGRKIYKKKVNNLIIILMKTNIKDIIKKGMKKHIYKLKKNVVGINIPAEFPRNPHIVVSNNFEKPIYHLSRELINKLKKLKIAKK